jgi:hypothetical protein
MYSVPLNASLITLSQARLTPPIWNALNLRCNNDGNNARKNSDGAARSSVEGPAMDWSEGMGATHFLTKALPNGKHTAKAAGCFRRAVSRAGS